MDELELMAGTMSVDRVGWLSRCDGVLYAGQEDDDDELVASLIIEAVEGAFQKPVSYTHLSSSGTANSNPPEIIGSAIICRSIVPTCGSK